MASYVTGIDIGHMAIRAVVLKQKKTAWVVHEFGEVERFYGSSGEKTLRQEMAELTTKVKCRGPVYVTDSTLNVMIRFVASVPLPEDRLRRLVRLDLAQHADDSGDLSADMYVVPVNADEIISCCPLAQPKQVNDLLFALAKSKVHPQALTIPAASLFNVGRKHLAENDGYQLIIDIGAHSTRLVITRGDEFIASRSLPIAGHQFSTALSEKQERSFVDAEKLKVSGLASKSDSPVLSKPFKEENDTEATAVLKFSAFEDESDGESNSDGLELDSSIEDSDDSSLFDDRSNISDPGPAVVKEDAFSDNDDLKFDDDMLLSDVVAPGNQTMQIGAQQLGDDLVQVAEQLHMQIASSLKWFRSQVQVSDMKIAAYHLSGGGAKLNGLRVYLEHRLGAQVSMYNPLDNIDCAGMQNTPAYCAAIGAAMQAEDGALSFDLRPESVLRKELWWKEIVWPRVAAALLLAAGILWAVSMNLNQSVDTESIAVYKKFEKERADQLTRLKSLQAERDAMFDDLRGIAGRIYAGRDLLNAIRAFKQEAPKELWITSLSTEGINVGSKAGDKQLGTSRSDTAIDRGMVRVAGRLMPDGTAPVDELIGHYEKWRDAITIWEESPGNKLFQSRKDVNYDVDHENERRTVFEVLFFFQPTTMDEVSQRMLHGGDDAP